MVLISDFFQCFLGAEAINLKDISVGINNQLMILEIWNENSRLS